MSDILNIRVTERELDLIMDLLHEAGERPDADGNPAIEICHDLMEQCGRWAEIEPTEPEELDTLTGKSFEIAENDFFNAGVSARQHLKASGSPPRDKEVGTSRAQMRRADHMNAPRGLYSADVYLKPNEVLNKYKNNQGDNFSFSVTENDFIDHQTRAIKTAENQRTQNSDLSETQRFDLWDDSDPKNW